MKNGSGEPFCGSFDYKMHFSRQPKAAKILPAMKGGNQAMKAVMLPATGRI